jgi:CubicO group peptidase (beta-lactamase class C family)
MNHYQNRIEKERKYFDYLVRKQLFAIDVDEESIGELKGFEYDLFLKMLDFDKKIELLMKLGHMPSLVACVIKKDKVVWSNAYGYSNLANEQETTLDTVYMLASITKTMTATAIMQLVEAGEIHLDDDVSQPKYLPFDLRHPMYPDKEITLRMLLAHQSGLSSHSARWFFYFSLLGYPNSYFKDYFQQEGYCYQDDVWTSHMPGKGVHYANEGIDLAASIVEHITGQTFEAYCKEHIFDRLGLSTIGFHLSEFAIDDMAIPYLFSQGDYKALPHYDVRLSGSGGARSTINDLMPYFIAHMNKGVYKGKRILSAESVEEMHRPQYPEFKDDGYQYGLGWYSKTEENGDIYGGHGGTVPGFRTLMKMREPDNVGIIYFYNRNNYFPYREDYRPIGWLERWARQQVEKLLFKKAEDY